MSHRKKNPRKRPSRTRQGRKFAAERQKRRARAFWAMRREEREPAEPPEPAWYKTARIWCLALMAGFLAWSIMKWIME